MKTDGDTDAHSGRMVGEKPGLGLYALFDSLANILGGNSGKKCTGTFSHKYSKAKTDLGGGILSLE